MDEPSNDDADKRDPAFKRTFDRARYWKPNRIDGRDARLSYRFCESILLDAVVKPDRERRSLLRVSLSFAGPQSPASVEALREVVGTFEGHPEEGVWLVRGSASTKERWHGFAVTRITSRSLASMFAKVTGAEVKIGQIPGSERPWIRSNLLLARRVAAWTRFCMSSTSSGWVPLKNRVHSAGLLGALWGSASETWGDPRGSSEGGGTPPCIASKPSICPACDDGFSDGRRDRVYCDQKCRQRAYLIRRAERRRLEAMADFLEDADPLCPFEIVPEDGEPMIVEWEISTDAVTREKFRERAAIIEEGCRVDPDVADWMAFNQLAPEDFRRVA